MKNKCRGTASVRKRAPPPALFVPSAILSTKVHFEMHFDDYQPGKQTVNGDIARQFSGTTGKEVKEN